MNVIFDVGNVLVNVYPALRLKQINEEYYHNKDMVKAFSDPLFWYNLDMHIISTKDEAISLFSKMYPKYSNVASEFFEGSWQDYYTVNEVGKALFLECLKRGDNVYILSNYFKLAFDYILNKFTFINEAKGIMVSYMCKLVKPDPHIYEYTINYFNLNKDDTIFIDDNINNIKGANEAKIRGILFENDLEKMREEIWK